jgi:hypothetical protein
MRVHCVSKQWARVVSDDVRDAIVHPAFDDIGVVKPGNGWRNDALATPAFCLIKSNLLKPGLVERDFFCGIGVCGIGQVGM